MTLMPNVSDLFSEILSQFRQALRWLGVRHAAEQAWGVPQSPDRRGFRMTNWVPTYTRYDIFL